MTLSDTELDKKPYNLDTKCFPHLRILPENIFEGFQPVVQQSTICTTGLAKPDMASQNRRKKLRRFNQLSTTRRNFLRQFCEAQPLPRKAHEPKRQTMDCCTTGWNPSIFPLGSVISLRGQNLICKTS